MQKKDFVVCVCVGGRGVTEVHPIYLPVQSKHNNKKNTQKYEVNLLKKNTEDEM